jgi:hypothetical protein
MRPGAQDESELLLFPSQWVAFLKRSMNKTHISLLGFNVLSDAVLASYPAHLFWKLQMKLRIKIALSILMGLGWVCVSSPLNYIILVAINFHTDHLSNNIELQYVQPSSATNWKR